MSKVKELNEKEYNELYKYSLNIAYKYVGYNDIAYDIAQNALLSFISSKNQVKSPFAWIRTIVKREAAKALEKEKKQNQITEKVSHVQKTNLKEEQDEADNLNGLDMQKAYQLLTKEDYDVFKKMKKAGFSLQKYAQKEKISYNTANSQKKRIKRNLLSALLWEEGWRSSDKILDYAQHNNIVRFIKLIFDNLQKSQLHVLKNYLEKVDKDDFESLFQGVESCLEWYVYTADNVYKLVLVFSPITPMPKIIELTFMFGRANYLKIISAEEKKPYLVINNNTLDEVLKYKDKGQINLTEEQLVSLLTNKKIDK
jgi:DNA-directed RNA polymerase specialized sigma24 family protein